MDCFVAELIIAPAQEGRARWLLAMTVQIAADPPSTNNSTPATKLESSEARKSAALAISSAVPIRPSGTIDVICDLTSSFANTSNPGVWIGPGLRTLTRICCAFRSAVQLRANERIAALVAL